MAQLLFRDDPAEKQGQTLFSGKEKREGMIHPLHSAVLAFACFLVPATSTAQPAEKKVARVAVFAVGPLTPQRQRNFDALRDELRTRGWEDGRNLTLTYHHAQDRPERLPELAASLARQPLDAIVAFGGSSAALPLQKATGTIPIVMIAATDPVREGLVRSLARPGGNITGTVVQHADLGAKRLEILKEALPDVAKVAVLYNVAELEPLRKAAPGLGVQLQLHRVHTPQEIESAFAAMRGDGADAVLVMPDAEVLEKNLRLVTSVAAQHRLPSIYAWRTYLDLADGLMSYGPSLPGLNRRAAYFVDRILRGTKPADLPVEFPKEFELVINLRAAKTLGLTLSQRLQLRADEIIQ